MTKRRITVRFIFTFTLFIGLSAFHTLCLTGGAEAQLFSNYPGSYRFKAFETEHFRIIFHQGLEETALEFADNAESIHEILSERLNWEPHGKTRLIFSNNLDITNGYTMVTPWKRVELFMTPPPGDSSIGYYDDWLNLVFAHEYTHVLHLDASGDLYLALRKIFGRFPLFFNAFYQPYWLIEGLAVFEESRMTGYGRLDSSYQEMIIREAGVSGRFPNRAQANGYQSSWPAGSTPYHFGSEFLQYLETIYGREKIERLCRRYAEQSIPFRVGNNAEHVLGKGYRELWEKWRQQLLKDGERRVDDKTDAGKKLTDRGWLIQQPVFHPAGKSVFFIESNADSSPSIRSINLETGEQRILYKKMYGGSRLSFGPDPEKAFFSRLAMHKSREIFSDLYLLDLSSGKTERLTRGARLSEPDCAPDGKRLICIKNRGTESEIVSYSLESDTTTVVRSDGHTWFSPGISPDGKKIAAVRRQKGKLPELMIMNDQGDILKRAAGGDGVIFSPVWSSDGERLYFSYDRTGVFNIYEYNAKTESLRKITDASSGAFHPAISPGGERLAYANYNADGFDLVLTSMPNDNRSKTNRPGTEKAASIETRTDEGVSLNEPEKANPAALNSDLTSYRKSEGNETQKGATSTEIHRYHPYRSLLPHYWFPVAGGDADSFYAGFLTSGMDVLFRHSWELQMLYNFDTDEDAVWGSYLYQRFKPNMHIKFEKGTYGYDEPWDYNDQEWGVDQEEWAWSLNLLWPVQRFNSRLTLGAGYFFRHFETTTEIPEQFPIKFIKEGDAEGLSASLSYEYSHYYAGGVSPEKGILFSTAYRDGGLSDETDFKIVKASAATYLPFFFKHHVPSLRVSYGASKGDELLIRRLTLGGMNQGITPETNESFPVRGYPQETASGDRAFNASAEYRFPLAYPENGPGNGIAFFDKFALTLFVDAGAAWENEQNFKDTEIKTSAGAEFHTQAAFFYLAKLDIRFGLAARLDGDYDDSPATLYFALGHAF